jgi:hypothetical protein
LIDEAEAQDEVIATHRRWSTTFCCVLSASAVVDDGGVRLICAGWLPHDDDSDVNGTAVYKQASLTMIGSNRLVARRFLNKAEPRCRRVMHGDATP